jgi:hypothetical protein
MAASEASKRQPTTPYDSMLGQGRARIFGTARVEAAGRGQERAQHQLITSHHAAGDPRSQRHAPALRLAAACALAISALNSASGASSAQARATNTTSTPRRVEHLSPR